MFMFPSSINLRLKLPPLRPDICVQTEIHTLTSYSVLSLSSLIFGDYYSILGNRCQPPNRSLLDLCSWLFFVFGRNNGHLVCHVPFLEELALSENRCSCQSLRCHSGNRRAHHCHGDCRNRKPGWFCKASNH